MRGRITTIKRAFQLLALGLCWLWGSAVAGNNEWTSMADQPSVAVNAVHIHPQVSEVLYAGAVDGFHRSTDDGRTWQNLGAELQGRNILSLGVDPQDGDRLYAGTSIGLFGSTDGGITWNRLEGAGTGVLAVTVDGNADNVYAGTFGRGVFSSTDGGANWSASEDVTLSEAIVFTLVASPHDAQTVYAGTATGLFVSSDAGANWRILGAALQGQSVRTIYPSEESPDLIVVGNFGGGILHSVDGGQNWAPLNDGLGEHLKILDIAVDPRFVGRSEQLLYAATSTGGVFRSKDSGQEWTAVNVGLPLLAVNQVVVHPLDGRVLSGGQNNGIWEISFTPEPQIEVTDAVNFSTVALGAISSIELDILNAGDGDLVITGLSLGNEEGFSVSPQGAFAIAPQSVGTITLSFQPGSAAVHRDTLIISSSDPDQESVTVLLRGTGIEAKLVIEPTILNFGEVAIGDSRDTTLFLRNAGNALLTVRNAFFDNNFFRVLSFQARTLRPSESMLLPVTFAPLIARGATATLTILSDDPNTPQIDIFADGIGVAADISTSATALDFGTVELGEGRNITMRISNSGNAELRLDRLTLSGVQFRTETTSEVILQPGESSAIEIFFLPLDSGIHSDTLTIFSNVPGRLATLKIPLLGTGGLLALRRDPAIDLGLAPVAMAVGDLDGDGLPDVAVVDSARGEVHVLLNDSQGFFPMSRRSVYPESISRFGRWDGPVVVAAAPIYGTAIDLVIGDKIARSVSLLANDGAGNFSSLRENIFIGHSLADVHVADLDADGDSDIVVANGEDSDSITLLFNNGSGSFSARVVLAVRSAPVAVVSGALDADGHNDLVVANQGDSTISVLLNDRLGNFASRQHYDLVGEPRKIRLADYDADGDRDILVVLAGSSNVAVLENDGDGFFVPAAVVPVGMVPQSLAVADLSADIFNDLVAVGAPPMNFLENKGAADFESQAIAASDSLREVDIADFNGDGHNDIIVLSTSKANIQVFRNNNAERLVRPRPPVAVQVSDVERDLGGSILIECEDGDFHSEEQAIQTTSYTVFRSLVAAAQFDSLTTVAAGTLSYTDTTVTPFREYYYQVSASRDSLESMLSEKKSVVSLQSPFFELELLNAALPIAGAGRDLRAFSLGDTLRARVYVTPAQQALTGMSVFLSYDDSLLTLIPDSADTTKPFRIDAAVAATFTAINNSVHGGAQSNKLDLSLVVRDLRTPQTLAAGVEPILLGEVWFLTRKETVGTIAVDDDSLTNRRSAVIDQSGELILPFIQRPTQVLVQDFQINGQVRLEGLDSLRLNRQISLFFFDQENKELASPLNDEDRLRPGIQTTMDAAGSFRLSQIPQGTYEIFAKAASHLQGKVSRDTVTIGDSTRVALAFQWVGTDSTRTTEILPAGDANDDNRVNLADFGLLVRHFGSNSADPIVWLEAQKADFDGDEAIGFQDFFLLAQNFGAVGMSFSGVSPKAHTGAGWLAMDEQGQVQVGGLGPISGFSFLVRAAEVKWESGETIWQGRRIQVETWPQKGGVRVLAALRDPLLGVEGDGLLIDLGPAAAGSALEEVGILHVDGSVSQPYGRRDIALPAQSSLLPNYPNPFNPATTIPFAIGLEQGSEQVAVQLDIFNLLGQQLRTLVNGRMPVGSHNIEWDGRNQQGHDVASGIYIYRLQVGSYLQTRRLMLLR
jgi:photosystem II stability/assembly factor-like uncharacterized protein